jgi:hypothetical protein
MASIVINGPPEEPAAPAADPWLASNGPVAIQADEMFARQLDTGFAGEIRTLVHDPETGLAGKGPEDALGGIAETLPMLGELKDRYLAQAIGPRQKAILEPLIDSRLDRVTGDLGRIAQQATSALDDRIVAERLAGLQQDAALAWHDPAHLRALGHAAVGELRYQGERKGWDETRTDTAVRKGLSDLYASAVEQAIGKDPDGAATLYEHARDVIQPDRQAVVDRKMERAREERGVSEVMRSLAEADDPTRRPDLDDYQLRADELTPPDASPEMRAQVNRMARIEHAQADRVWQAARGRSAVAALDWLAKNSAAPLLAMPPALRDGLSPEQTERLDAAAINGGRPVTDGDIYEALDRQAVYEAKAFAGLDLSQYRLSLDDEDYQRLLGFQKAFVEGRSDAAFERYGLGRTFLDQGLHKANFDPDGPEARTSQQQLDRLLGDFEAIEGRPPMMADLRVLVGDVVRRLVDDSNIVRVAGGDPAGADGHTQVAQQQEPAEGRRGIAPNIEPPPGRPIKSSLGHPVMLPGGSYIPDRYSPTGYLMAPTADLGPVATAGRQAGVTYRLMMAGGDPVRVGLAQNYLIGSLGIHLGHAGMFDYQREGSIFTKYDQHPQWRNVSNVNVGLFCQQAGLPLDMTLSIAGTFALVASDNRNLRAPYFLNHQTAEFIKLGYELGEARKFEK